VEIKLVCGVQLLGVNGRSRLNRPGKLHVQAISSKQTCESYIFELIMRYVDPAMRLGGVVYLGGWRMFDAVSSGSEDG
jgi:hypothetical protein